MSAKDQAKRLRAVMCELEGVVYVLDALADMGTEATNALRNQSRELDRAFIEIEQVADELEQASGEGVA